MMTFHSKKPERRFHPKPEQVQEEKPEPMRLNKYIAHAGICSRRDAADLVKKGDILVNGKVEINPAYLVKETDKIIYNGILLQAEERKVYLLMNKPKDTVTTTSDEKGRKTVYDLVKSKYKERIYPVGRLDRNTTGLLLLTNDGDLAQRMMHPSFQIKKIYHATLDKPLTLNDFKKIEAGLTLEDGPVRVDGLSYIDGATKDEVGIIIHSGRNRIIRRIFEHLGYEVTKLDRVYLGGLTKKNLPRGFFRELNKQEVIMLKHFHSKKQI